MITTDLPHLAPTELLRLIERIAPLVDNREWQQMEGLIRAILELATRQPGRRARLRPLAAKVLAQYRFNVNQALKAQLAAIAR